MEGGDKRPNQWLGCELVQYTRPEEARTAVESVTTLSGNHMAWDATRGHSFICGDLKQLFLYFPTPMGEQSRESECNGWN